MAPDRPADRERRNELIGKGVAQFAIAAVPLDGADPAELVDLAIDLLQGAVDPDTDRVDKGRQLAQDELRRLEVDAARRLGGEVQSNRVRAVHGSEASVRLVRDATDFDTQVVHQRVAYPDP